MYRPPNMGEMLYKNSGLRAPSPEMLIEKT
jgi:hypothetical protein